MSKCAATIPESWYKAVSYLSSERFQFHHRPCSHFLSSDSPFELLKLQAIHSVIVGCGFSQQYSSFLKNLLFKCLSLPSPPCAYILLLFKQIPDTDVFTYNALIRGFKSQTAVFFYVKMRCDGIFPNKHTFPLLLKAKTHIPFQVYAQAIKFRLDSDIFLRNSLILDLACTGHVNASRQVFDEMTNKDLVSYTALMDGYVKNSRACQALEVFLEMKNLGVGIDEVAVVSGLSAVGMLSCIWVGKWIHGFYVEPGRVVRDVYIGCALIDMYSKCGFWEDASRVFREMPHRNLVSWSALLSGYVQCDRFNDALLLFQEMLVEKYSPSEATLASVLTACAQLGALEQGRWINKYIGERKLTLNSILGTTLIDMYAKCGYIKEAFRIFEKIHNKDVYPWTALIFGLAMNGDAKGALILFYQMLRNGVQPNEVTFISVLSACSHGGLITEGWHVFAMIDGLYGMERTVDHYGCMVDLLGRGGRLGEAMELIQNMPMEPSARIWGSLFGACMIHKEFELGKTVGNRLVKLQPYRSGRYALLANMYSHCRSWEKAARMRKTLNEMGVDKAPGCSCIECDGILHEFVAFDKSLVGVNDVLNIIAVQIAELPAVLGDGIMVL